MDQPVNGANKAVILTTNRLSDACVGREAYAECFKIRKCGCYRFRKA